MPGRHPKDWDHSLMALGGRNPKSLVPAEPHVALGPGNVGSHRLHALQPQRGVRAEGRGPGRANPGAGEGRWSLPTRDEVARAATL